MYYIIPKEHETLVQQLAQQWLAQSDTAFIILTGYYSKIEPAPDQYIYTVIPDQQGHPIPQQMVVVDFVEGLNYGLVLEGFVLEGFVLEGQLPPDIDALARTLTPEVKTFEQSGQVLEFFKQHNLF